MKKNILFITSLLVFCFSSMQAQVFPVDDDFCVQLGEPFPRNVTENDDPSNSGVLVLEFSQSECFRIKGDGEIVWLQPIDAERCCGEHTLLYGYAQDETDTASVTILVKCAKPDCGLVDLGELSAGSDPIGGNGKVTIDACEGSLATYYVDYNPNNSYVWNYSGEMSAMVNPLNPAEIDIVWGVPGGGYISVSIYNLAGTVLIETIEVCINILDGPDAAFTAVDSCVCNNAPISFINQSIGGNDYFWEFGDGMTSTQYSPTHQYTNPGTYQVILYVTQDNFDAEGNPSCCCTDTATMTITVDSLDGPNIYWISTLCEGDSSKYWTDADCGTYTWSATDANGNTVTVIPTANPDTVCVVWPTGPYGTITLKVTGCTPALCEKPVSVNVPVIQSVANISGAIIVCAQSTHSYTLPKWPSVEYIWNVSGGTVVSGDGTNSVIIHWGPAGPGTIDVTYGSDFLNGLPIHDGDDCYGTAHLDVSIRDEFQVFSGNNTVCVGDQTFHNVFPATGYNWSISPNPGFIIPNGVSNQIITWNTTAGNYVVKVYPPAPNPYCNDTVRFLVQVKDIAEPDSVTGPFLICPGETYTYFPHTSTPSVGFQWHIMGGTPSNVNGNPVQITWDASGPYKIGLTQFSLNDPMCQSDTIFYTVLPKEIMTPLSVTGTPACVNEISSYTQTTPQDADAIYKWTISPPAAGSVYSPQGLSNVDVQWNDLAITANLICTVYLCGDSAVLTTPITIHMAAVPTISQIGYLCPGVPAQLTVPNVYSNYAWSHTGTNSNTVGIINAGVYELVVTDAFGCTAIASFEAFNVAGPIAEISTPSLTDYCLPDDVGAIATIVAQTTGNENYTWYCNGTPQVLPATATTLQHTVTSAFGLFCYWVDVQDLTTLCITRSDTICIRQADCPPGNCIPFNYMINTTASVHPTFCNQVTFGTTGSGYQIQSWNFLDPDNNVFTGPLTNPTHVYSEAGCYLARVHFTANPPVANGCVEFDTVSVCVPIAADFEWTTDCAKYTFNDLSTYLNPDVITSWLWDFGDGDFSTMQNPMHTFDPGMTFNVKLTVANASGCQATITKIINTYGQPDATFIATPDTVCVGDEVHFTLTGSTAGILYYNWDFDDLSSNGGSNPYHGYTSDATYNVTLIVEDVNGCMDTFSAPVVVYPLPPYDTISYTPSLVICEGATATLTAPSGSGYMYQWNTLATTQTINVTTGGIYSVTVTDGNGCVMIPDSVEVIVIVFPDPIITGPDIICENSCITLSTTAGFGYTYIWRDQANNDILTPNANGNKLEVCHPTPLYSSVTVEVTDPNGCRKISAPFSLTVAPNPIVGINVISGTLCEGTPTQLMATSSIAGSTFSWSNGASGPNITVYAEGTYTVIATDPATGCTGSESIVVNPQPDLCLVPFGCYEVCNPDTICGPDGLIAYQWYQDGLPIPAPLGDKKCFIVMESGTYWLTGTNIFGCSTTSDSLILEIIECCEPGDTEITAEPVPTFGDSCCWSLSYFNALTSTYGMTIHTNNADIVFNPSTIDPSLILVGSGSGYVSLASSILNDPLPTGNLAHFIEICLTNVTSSPVQVIVDWVGLDGTVICSDTIELECTVEPPCAYIAHDSIYCENETVIYTFTLCNPASASFPVGYVNIVPVSPAGIVLSPTAFTLSPQLQPGNCIDLTMILGGGNFSNQNFCFNLIAHEFDPAIVDTAECCTVDTMYCIPIPGCTPCDMVYVSSIDTVDIDECCYSVDITNNFSAFAFSGIKICALGGSTIQVQNNFSTMWTTTGTSPTEVSLIVNSTSMGSLPLGTSTLPDICITSGNTAITDIVIKWMNGDNIECMDTISLFCPGDCGFVTDTIACNQQNGWIYEGYITNTSSFTIADAAISFTTPGYNVYNTNINVGALLPGNTYGPFFIVMNDPPAQNGDVVCMVVTLHSVGHNNQHTSCCSFTHCFTLPNCNVQEPNCECDQAFEAEVALGINCSFDASTGIGTFSPAGNFSDCDKIIWSFVELQIGQMTVGNQSINQAFTKEGDYTICMTVIRTTPTGKQCKEKFTKEFEVELDGLQAMNAYPNPAHGMMNISFRKLESGMAQVHLIDINQKTIGTWERPMDGSNIQLDVSYIPQGLYYLVVQTEKGRHVEKMIIFR